MKHVTWLVSVPSGNTLILHFINGAILQMKSITYIYICFYIFTHIFIQIFIHITYLITLASPVLISQSSQSFLSSLWISARKTCKHLILSSSISFRFTSFSLVSFADMLQKKREREKNKR